MVSNPRAAEERRTLTIEELFSVPDAKKFNELTKKQIVDRANDLAYKIGDMGVCNDDALNIAFTLLLAIAIGIVEQLPHEKRGMKGTLKHMFGEMLKIYDDTTKDIPCEF